MTASIDYWGYNDIVAQALADDAIGGSPACRELVGRAFDALTAMLDDVRPGGGRGQLEGLFHTCGPIVTDGDGWMLHDYVSDDFMGLVQYNNPRSTTRGVRQTCSTLLSAATGATPLARLVNITRARAGGKCINDPSDGSGAKTIRWEDHLKGLVDAGNVHRAWPYQQCVDGSGHDQTCRKAAGCLFSERYASPKLFGELCTRLFGTSPAVSAAAITGNSLNYGDNRTGGTNILYVNGQRDPFSWGGVTRNTTDALSRNVVALVVESGSHCADMGRPSAADWPSMAAAKAVKRAWVRRVLGVDDSTDDSTDQPSAHAVHDNGQQDGRDHDVLVVGAGYAGMSAAHTLLSAGLDVLVLEAAARVGGRTRNYLPATGSYDVATDSVVELGGTFVSPSHTALIAFAAAMGVGVYNTSSAWRGGWRRRPRAVVRHGLAEPADLYPWWYWGVDTEGMAGESVFHTEDGTLRFRSPAEFKAKLAGRPVFDELETVGQIMTAAVRT